MASRTERFSNDPGFVAKFFGPQERFEIKEGQTPGSVAVRLMNFKNPNETQSYVNFLQDMRNRIHFSRPPQSIDELKAMPKKSPSLHFLVGTVIEQIEQEGKNKSVERTVGGALIDDAAFGEHDSGLRLFVIDADRQGQGLGDRQYFETLLWAFLTETYDGRPRTKLDFSVILNDYTMLNVLKSRHEKSEDWTLDVLDNPVKRVEAIKILKDQKHPLTRLIRIAENYGAHYIYSLPKEADVPGQSRPQPTARYETTIDAFKTAIKSDPKILKRLQASGLTDFL